MSIRRWPTPNSGRADCSPASGSESFVVTSHVASVELAVGLVEGDGYNDSVGSTAPRLQSFG